MPATSSGFSFDKNDVMHTIKVCGYSCLAAITSCAVVLLTQVHIPMQYMFLVPLVNTILVGVERWAKDHSQQ